MKIKLLISLIILICSCSDVIAQSWQELDSISNDYINKGNFDSALVYAKRALVLAEKEFGLKDINYANACNTLGLVYDYTAVFEEAEKYYYKAYEISKAIYGDKHGTTTTCMNNLAVIYLQTGEYNKAEDLLIKIVETEKEILGENDSQYAVSLSNLGELYRQTGKYDEAIQFIIKSLIINKNVTGIKSIEYALSLNNLASIYIGTGQFDMGIPIMIESSDIYRTMYGENHSDYAGSLSNLGVAYKERGYYGKAEAMYLKALEIDKASLGESHPNYATDLNNLAVLYDEIGQFEKAQDLFNQTLIFIKNIYGVNNPFYINTLQSLALTYTHLHQFEKADSVNLEVLNLSNKFFSENSYEFAKLYNNIAGSYFERGQLDSAEQYFIKARIISEKIWGSQHADMAKCNENLSSVYFKKGKFDLAEQLLLKAYEIRKFIFGGSHPYYLKTISNLAVFYRNIGKYDKAYPFFIESGEKLKWQISEVFGFLSEKEKTNFYKSARDFFDSYNSFCYDYYNVENSLASGQYNVELSQKGIILGSLTETRNAILLSNDSVLLNKYNSWVKLKQQLAFLKRQSFDKQENDKTYIIKIENDAEKIEKEMLAKSKRFSALRKSDSIDWKYIQKSLGADEVAIELSSFYYDNRMPYSDSILYCALLVRPGYTHPEMKFLFEQKQLDSLLSLAYENDHQFVEQIYAGKQKENKLYSLIWKPIDTLLQGVKTVYFSPSGLLHKISFAAIPTPDGKYLSDKYNLVQLGSTREIIKLKEKNDYITQSDNALIYGGVNYNKMDTLPDTLQTNALLSEVRSVAVPADSTQKNYPMNYLKETLAEAEFIDKLFESNKISSLFYSGSQATETSFKYTSGKSPQVIHIATHGYFYPDIKKKKEELELLGQEKQFYRFSENPLLRSGLMFAGANKVWTGGEAEEGRDDGILTAYEVSNMNLSNTKLVVLSACQTGLGDIKGSEGVFGLQRAFKMAGVKYIIASLWQVPGKETNEFMQLFYAHCFKNQSIREAFNNAQAKMRNKYSPYYWGAFVLME